jgi:glycosyltransferase
MKVSIITVCYNSGKTIKDTLNSVSSQSYHDYEHIIIDGKSVDNTLALIDQYKSPKSIVLSESDAGIYDAMNKGLRISTGDIVGFLNSDDRYHNSSSLSDIVNSFSHANINCVWGNLLIIDRKTNRVVRDWISSSYSFNKIKYGWMPPHPTFYIRSNFQKKIGFFNLKYKLSSDYDFMLRCITSKDFVGNFINKYLITMNSGGASAKSIVGYIKNNIMVVHSLRGNNINFNIIVFILTKVVPKLINIVKYKIIK